ncbi:hypothetical protein FVEN_g13100 [Fusarium venenatum]|uniref:Uncharacterized protein n=1 Tax=Fusarium venenatum TaxID=56646 RepID=A0A2L2TEY8_9HYPO|nr:uncharacterized protein FVRRES_12813 [Fusarium venenatum]KAG8349353.1 hypothetical protein FVEN_g13100 [Fusarium venenatum]CEI40122.1 unnamed protein product [Fusarium venenatum]
MWLRRARDKRCTATGEGVGNGHFCVQMYVNDDNVTLRLSHLPLINASKGGYIPMELAFVESMQRYPFKLNTDQTTLY